MARYLEASFLALQLVAKNSEGKFAKSHLSCIARDIRENFAYRISSSDKILEARLKVRKFAKNLRGGEAKLYH